MERHEPGGDAPAHDSGYCVPHLGPLLAHLPIRQRPLLHRRGVRVPGVRIQDRPVVREPPLGQRRAGHGGHPDGTGGAADRPALAVGGLRVFDSCRCLGYSIDADCGHPLAVLGPARRLRGCAGVFGRRSFGNRGRSHLSAGASRARSHDPIHALDGSQLYGAQPGALRQHLAGGRGGAYGRPWMGLCSVVAVRADSRYSAARGRGGLGVGASAGARIAGRPWKRCR